MNALQTPAHKLGANRNELARGPRRARRASESRDVREDRGARQSKFAQPDRTVQAPIAQSPPVWPVARRAGALELKLLPERTTAPKSKPARLCFRRDGARSVFVAGTFNDWEPLRLALRPDDEGGWEIELLLPAGDYEYRLFVDGAWTDDPSAGRVVPNPFGGVNAVLHVQGD